jgi:glutaredoxin
VHGDRLQLKIIHKKHDNFNSFFPCRINLLNLFFSPNLPSSFNLNILGITTTLEEKKSCPYCHSENITIEQIIPNKTLRLAIQDYIQQQEEQAEARKKEQEQMDEQQQQQEEAEGGNDDVEEMDTKEDSTRPVNAEEAEV